MRIEKLEYNDEVEDLIKSGDLHVSDLCNSKQTRLFGVRIDARLIGV
jgi:hypothetical protein